MTNTASAPRRRIDDVGRQQEAVFAVCFCLSLLLLAGSAHLALHEPVDVLAVLASSLMAFLGLALILLRRNQSAACLLGLYCVLLAALARDNVPIAAGAETTHSLLSLPLLPVLWVFLLGGIPLLFAWTYTAPGEVRLAGSGSRRLFRLLVAGLLAQAGLLAAERIGPLSHFASTAFDTAHSSPYHRLLLESAPIVFLLHLAALMKMWRFYRREPLNRHRYVLLLMDAGLLFLATAVVADAQRSLGAYVLSNTAAYVVAVLLVYALERHALFGIRLAVRRVVQYALARQTLTAMLIGPLMTLSFFTGVWFTSDARRYHYYGIVPALCGILFTVSALMLALRAPLLRWFDRTYFREVYDAQRVLADVGRSLLGVEDRQEIARAALNGIDTVLHSGYALLLAEDAGQIVCCASRHRAGFRAPAPPLEPALLALRRVCEVHAPKGTRLPLSGVAEENAVPAALWKRLRDDDAHIIVPLRQAGRTIGLILLGEKASGLSYSPEDIEMLGAMSLQIALALQLARQNQELIRRNTQELTSQSVDFVELVEQERRLLAADLHDQTLPELRALLADLESLAASPSPDPRTPTPDAMTAHLRQTIGNIRDIMESLRPSALEMLGLLPALESELRKAAARARPPVIPHFQVRTDALPEGLTPFSEVSIFRIVQEAVNNACRHARAAQIGVLIDAEDASWILRVEDDGAGLPPEAERHTGHGLNNIAYRAGLIGAKVTWTTPESGVGTRFELRLPLHGAEESAPPVPSSE